MDTVEGSSGSYRWKIAWVLITIISFGSGIVLFYISGNSGSSSLLPMGVTFCIFILQVVLSYKDVWANKSEHENLILNLGIFGTFVGIVIGLANFNVSENLNVTDVGKQLSPLLNGMKTAFITSAVGLAYACLIIFRGIADPSEASGTETGEELQESYMEEARMFFREQHAQGKVFQKILEALIGNSPESLSTKLQSIQNTIAETKTSLLEEGFESLKAEQKEDKNEIVAELRELQKEFRNYAEIAAKSNIEALMEALKETMRDFNNNLTEQFGDNFKKLNESVDKLLIWQSSYKEHIEETEKHLKAVLERFDFAQAALEEVSENARVLVDAGDSIAESSSSLQQEHSVILEQLESLSSLKDNIASLPEELKTVVERFSTVPVKAEELHKSMLKEMGEIYQKTSDALVNHHTELMQSSQENIDKIKEAFSKSSSNLDEVTAKLRGNFSDQVQDNINRTINFVADVEKSLHQQLQTILAEFGNKLTTISEEMVKLYKADKTPRQGR